MAKQTFTTGQVLTAAQMTSLQDTAMGGGNTTAKTTSYVLVAADAGTVVAMNAAGATTITVNTALFAAGDTVTIQNRGAGVCTVTAGTATVVTAGSLALVQNEGGILYFTATGAATFYDFVQASGSSVPTSLEFTAGKNKVINGDFGVWQRGTSFGSASYPTFYADRFYGGTDGSGITRTVSQQTFTPGSAPVAGYEGKFFLRVNQSVAGTGSSYNVLDNRIEDVQTLAGQTATLSFWAKADAARTVTGTFTQYFGVGGSGNVDTSLGSFSVTTSWTRFTVTISVPSLSGKTIASGSSVGIRFNLPLNTVQTIDFWGLQLEAGSTATAFQTATGTLQGELAACQRYYFRAANTQTFSFYGTGSARNTTTVDFLVNLPVAMRVIPTTIDSANLGVLANGVGATALTNTVIDTTSCTNAIVSIYAQVASGLTQFRFYYLANNNNSAGYLGLSAEL